MTAQCQARRGLTQTKATNVHLVVSTLWLFIGMVPIAKAGTNDLTFANWQAMYFSAGQLLNSNLCWPNADPDGDGLVNLQEYAFALNPTQQDLTGLPGQIAAHPENLSFSYTRISAPLDLLYQPVISTDLTSWSNAPAYFTKTFTPCGTGLVQQVEERMFILEQQPPLFARLQVVWTGHLWKTDIFWRKKSTGGIYLWLMDGTNRLSSLALDTAVSSAWVVEDRADLDGNGQRDPIWRNSSSGAINYWLLDGTNYVVTNSALTVSPTAWRLTGTGDFNGDGKADILWQKTSTGELALWSMNGAQRVSSDVIISSLSSQWKVMTGSFGNNRAGLLLRSTSSGNVNIWLMDGPTIVSVSQVATNISSLWQIQAIADFNGDRCDDILWRNGNTGELVVWFMDGPSISSRVSLISSLSATWQIQQVSDFNGDHKADILFWKSTTGQLALWVMDGAARVTTADLGTVSPSSWQIIP